MKRMLLLLLVLSISLSCSAALAGCSEHPDAEDNFWHSYTEYTYWNENLHKVQDYGVLHCEACDVALRTEIIEFLDYHTIVDDICFDCGRYFGYFDGTPTPDALQQQAFQRITEDPDGIAGKTATVIHNGNLRASADQHSTDLGAVIKDEEYEILSYVIIENQSVWLEVKYGIGSAWISASLVDISGKNALDNAYADYYIGQMCTIKVSSGRARLAPDKDAPVVGYVGYKDKYKILDCQPAPDGTLWFLIKVDNKEGWISSGLADVY